MPLFDPIRDAAFRIIGYTSTNQQGQVEYRTPESLYVGSHDPAPNISRDEKGIFLGLGNHLPRRLNDPGQW
jgi:hypothetical protein